MKRFTTSILSLVLALGMMLSATSVASASDLLSYEDAINRLGSISLTDREELNLIYESFEAIGSRYFAPQYMYLTATLLELSGDENVDFDRLEIALTILKSNSVFVSEYMADKSLVYLPLDSLLIYVQARKLEAEGALEEAYEAYVSCQILDSIDRAIADQLLLGKTSTPTSTPTPMFTLMSSPTPIPSNIAGNTAGNITNGGMAAQSGIWIYYQNTSDNRYLYKLNTQTNAETQLNSDNTMYINVIDDLIIYSNYSDNQKIYRMNTDGTGRTKICDDTADTVTLVGEWIYYRNGSDSGSLYKIMTDGTNRTKLNSQNSYCINVVGDTIYYSHDGGGFYIKSIGIDGTNMKTLNDDYSYDLNVVDGWIYYTNYKYDAKFYKIRTDGTDRTQVDSVAGFNKNISDGWLYFVNWDDGKRLYKMKLDGSEKIRLTDVVSSSPIVLDEWIYYYVGYTGDTRDLCRIPK